jgi:hypothetical protein
VLSSLDVTGTSDELPEEAGRRQMVIRISDDRLTVEASDPALVEAGRAALAALGESAGTAGTIRGDRPECAGLSTAWQALLEALTDVQRRAAPGGEPPEGTGQSGTEAA